MMDKTILHCGGGWLSGDACIEALFTKVETCVAQRKHSDVSAFWHEAM